DSSYGYLNTVQVASPGGQLTIGPGITIHGGIGSVGYNPNLIGPANVSFINQGTISADSASAGGITLDGIGWSNTGIIQAPNGGHLALSGKGWTNAKTVSVSGGGIVIGN